MTSVRTSVSPYMPHHPYRLALPDSAEYDALSQLITQVFARAYKAEVTVTFPQLLGVYNADGVPQAALGMRSGAKEKFFLEHYLDHPAEEEIHARIGLSVSRRKIAEAGNLASISRSALRNLMLALSVTLKQDGFDYILFTGTESLKRYLELLGLKPVVYAEADPSRLGEEVVRWGSYYETRPKVMGGTVDEFYHGLIAAYCGGTA